MIDPITVTVILLDPLVVIPAIAIGYYSNSVRGLTIGIGILLVLVQFFVFQSMQSWDSRLLVAATVGGAFYLAGGSRRRWRRGEL